MKASVLEVDGGVAALQEFLHDRGWTDGLPVVPPLEELVEEMLRGAPGPAERVIATIAPSLVAATLEKVAINAVMAGCRSDYLPVIVAAIRAMARPQFNLAGIQATTHPVAPLIFVNGPIRQRIGLNCAAGALGQGTRANATIGRAIRLALMNLGGAIPGQTDMATHGTPCKFSYCMGELEEDSPWAPLHVDAGLRPEDSAVTVFAAEAPHNVNDHGSQTAPEVLQTIADSMNTAGANNLHLGGEMMLVLGPEHARILAAGGMSKADVREALHALLRVRLNRISPSNLERYRTIRPAFVTDAAEVSYFDKPEQIVVTVAGGAGKHSLVIPGFGSTAIVTERIDTA